MLRCSMAAVISTVNVLKLNALPAVQCQRWLSLTAPKAINCHRASISRIKSPAYCRLSQVLLVNSDGSTINIRYEKPRKIIRLPVDLTSLTEEERLARLDQRKPKSKVVIEDELEDFDVTNKYRHLWKSGS